MILGEDNFINCNALKHQRVLIIKAIYITYYMTVPVNFHRHRKLCVFVRFVNYFEKVKSMVGTNHAMLALSIVMLLWKRVLGSTKFK